MQLDKQNQFIEIVQLIKKAQANAISIVNTELVNLYWNIGAYISKQLTNSNWGDKTVDELANYIQREYPELRGFNRRGLYRMKQFYETYHQTSFVSSVMTQIKENDIKNSFLAKISWTHHLILISRAKTDEEREFYLQLCIKERYTVKELERQINSGLFERIIIGNNQIPVTIKDVHPDITNNLKDNYVLEFLGLPQLYNEHDLQKALVSQMKDFILELGKDFLFIGEQYKVQVGKSDFYIDLLFFHRGLQCLVAFELKADKFKPEHLGQLNFYLEALDRDVKKANENPSIGILLCKDRDNEVVEYALSRCLSPTMVAEYQIQLPDKKLLQKKLQELFK